MRLLYVLKDNVLNGSMVDLSELVGSLGIKANDSATAEVVFNLHKMASYRAKISLDDVLDKSRNYFLILQVFEG